MTTDRPLSTFRRRSSVLPWLLIACLAVGWCGGCRPAAKEPQPQPQPEAADNGTSAAEPTAEPADTAVNPDLPTPAETPAVGDSPMPAESASVPVPTETPPSTEAASSPASEASIAAAAPAGETPDSWSSWPSPQLAIVVTGNQFGYIEPCGCTGLDNQKGGLARRMTFIDQLRDAEWSVLPIDAGNQVRRFGRQAEIKFQTTADGLQQMGYGAVGFGPNDLRLGVGELVAVAASDDPEQGMFVSANVTLIDPSLTAQHKLIEQGGRKVGITSVIDPAALEGEPGGEIEVAEVVPSITAALAEMSRQETDFRVLLFYGEEAAAIEAVRQVPGFDLLVVAGGFGEPTYRPQAIEGSATRWIVTGNKGMYAGIIGLYPDEPFRYARVAMTHDFEDAAPMRQLMATYQNQLEAIGLAGLGLRPIAHPSGDRFVGSQACGDCHTTAYAIWEGTPHFLATDHIVQPGERGDVPRHFDPECLSCHVTGWNPQNYYPYESGYLSLAADTHLSGNGCENCHGPGAKHVAAEQEGSQVAQDQRDLLRMAMRLPLDKAKDQCLQCHDLDNSPDFHKDGAFDDYWAEVEHYGLD
ncbi:MAG: cytochrome C554 [Planctomycetaceae bacterium]|nr:MAG: cytochrome C554 [Planctomycetaceae bacterium]